MSVSEPCPDFSSADFVTEWAEEKMPEFLKDLDRICSIRSFAEIKDAPVPPFGEGCIRVLNEMLRMGSEYGFSTRNYDNYVGRISLEEEEKPSIGIWAHLDVVHEGNVSLWNYPPFRLSVKDGYAIARGANDNKSSAILGLYVLRYLKEHNLSLKHPVHLYTGTCEEQGMFDLDYFTAHYPCPALSLVPDSGFPVCCGERGAFNGELTSIETVGPSLLSIHADDGLYMLPGNADALLDLSADDRKKAARFLESAPEYRNFVTLSEEEKGLRVTCTGVSIHAANPFAGKNALELLCRFLTASEVSDPKTLSLLSLCTDLCADYHGTALGIRTEDGISGPIVLSVTQAELADRRLVFRFISKYPVTSNDFPYEETASAKAKERGFLFKTTRKSKANYFPPDDPAVTVMTDTYNEIMHEKAEPFVMSGGTYAHKLPHAFACGTGMPGNPPKGLFLPGHGDYHQPDEAISIERMKKALIIYIIGILRLDKIS